MKPVTPAQTARAPRVSMNHNIAVWAICLPLVLLSATGEVAVAQAGSDDISVAEVVVTAQKRSQNLQEVPISVTAVSGSSLVQAGIETTQALSSVVAGLDLPANGSQLEPHLRGIGTTSSGPGSENSVALYVDGVYFASQSATLFQLNNIAQIAVLKGPQGTLFGRNATGGVIQITTADPTQDFQATVATSLDNFLTTRSDLYVSGGVMPGVAADLTAQYAYQGLGWGNNLATGEDIDRIKRQISLRSKWLFSPSDTTRVKLIFDYANTLDNLNSNNFIPYPGTSVALPGSVRPADPFDIDQYGSNRSAFQGGGASATLEQELGFARLTSISAYRKDSYNWGFDFTESPTPGEFIEIANPTEEITQELQLASLAGSRIQWVAGLFYFYDSSSSDPTRILLGPLYQQALGLGEIGIIANQRANSAAAFGQATAEVFSQTNLTLGARYTYERRNYVGFEQGSLPSGASIGLISDDFREHEVAHAPSWRVALDRKLGAELLGYVSYNRGFKSGGFNGFDPTNPPYQPEYLNAYELGLKSQWLDQRLRLNTAAFLYNYSNIQISRYNITADVYNGAKARVYGLDLDGEARITPALSVTGSLEWLHSKFLDFPLAQFSTPLPGGGNTLFLASAQGNQLPYAPKFTLSLGATYRKSFELGSIAVNVTNAYNSGYFAETDNFLRQGAYDYLNSSLTWTAVDGKLSVRLFANNLLDKAVASQIGTASFGYFQAYANPPRTYGFSLQYQVR